MPIKSWSNQTIDQSLDTFLIKELGTTLESEIFGKFSLHMAVPSIFHSSASEGLAPYYNSAK